MICQYCQNQLPETGYYCPNCAKQSKCTTCGEILIKDAIICVECGTEVKGKTINPYNTIEFSENRNTRIFKASFTDTVGTSISQAFGIIIANKNPGAKNKNLNGLPPIIPSSEPIDAEAEILDENKDSNELNEVKKIIRIDGEKANLIETRLKAKSKRDYAKRLTIIFLYHKSLLGVESVPRRELTTIVDSASVEDGNFRHWLSNNPQIGVDGDMVQIKTPGLELAKTYIQEIFNPDIKDRWQIGTQSRGRKAKDKKTNEKGK